MAKSKTRVKKSRQSRFQRGLEPGPYATARTRKKWKKAQQGT